MKENTSFYFLLRLLSLSYIFLQSLTLGAQNELTTSGTDFWLGFMDNYLIDEDATYTVFISSDQVSSGSVEIPLLGWSETFTVIPGTTTTIDIPLIANNNQSGVISNKGVHVTSDNDINLCAINHVPNSADATRILPKSFLDISYFVNAYEGQTNIVDTLRSELLIVSTEDQTEIEINPSCDMLGGALQNVPFVIQLSQGETYLLKAAELEDVSGTTITGTDESGDCRPFAVFGGSECSFVPQLCSPCDHIFDQIIPSSVWGTEYFMGTFDTWISSYTFRVTAAQDNTEIFIDGVSQFVLDSGETQEVNSNSEPIYLSSTAPVGVIQYMEGGGCTISGDPSMMSLNSASQTLSQATFATVESDIITNHHLQIIVPSNAIEEVFVDGVQIPSLNFNVFDGNQEYSFADVEIPEGSHTLFCEQRFIANVYGIGDAESYFYSTGASASDPLEPIPTVFCTDNQVILETAENYTNIWWSTIEEPEVSIFVGQPFVIDPPIQNQIYILNGDNFLSGCPEQEFYSVESPSPLNVDILEDEIDLCLFEQFSLSSDVTPQGSGYVYQWSDESAFITNENQTGLISPSQSGTYYLDVSTFSGCAVGIDSVLANVINDDITSVYASVEPESICEGQSVALSMNTGYNSGIDQFNSGTLNNSLWINDQGSEISNLCGTEGTSSIYFNGIGSRFIESIDLDMNEGGTIQFSLFISDGSNSCDGAEFGENVQLEYSINGGINWIPISIFFEDQFPNFENIEILIPSGAETNSTRFRWIQNNFTGLNEDIWALDNIIFSSFGPDFEPVSWTSSAIIDDPSLPETSSFPSESGYFYLESQIGVCTYTDSVFIEVDPSFDLTISEDTTICSPLPVSLLVSTSEPGFYTYQWDNDNFLNASNTANPIAIPEESTIFSVQVNSPSGCSQSAEVEINLLSEEAPFIFTESSSVCEGPIPLEVVVQDDPNDYTFEWSPAELLDDPFAQSVNAFPESGSFNTLEVNVTNTVTGCTNTASQTLSALFAEFELPSDTIICESEGFVLEYNVINSMFNAIEWDTPDVLDNAFTQFPTITVPDFNGDLVVTMFVPGIGGCSVSDTISIITQELEIEVPDVLSNCFGQEIQTEITGDFNSISWLPSENLDDSQDDFPIFSNEETETFYYSAEGGGGCTLNDSIQIVINLPESFEILASELLCEGAEINLSHPISGMNYLWNTNETTEAITISNSGSYNLEVMDSAGCIVSDEIEIEMFNAPNFEITGETEVCEGESIILTADIVDVDYLWSNLETNQTEEFSLSGAVDIWAEVTDIMGCTFRDSVLINFRPDPDLLLESSGSICEGSSVVISAQSNMVDFLWETNQTTDQIEVFESQFYSVTVTDAFNCSRSDSIFISEVIFPENFELDNSFCQGTELIISPEVNSNFDVSWSTGEESNVLSINQAGEYQMILENDNCIQEYDFTIFEDECPEPYIYVPNAFTPDGDGVNDHWSAIVSELIIDFEVQVFNRDGDLIFQSKDPLDIWTGNVYNGEYYAPNGVYSYKITYHTESEIEGLISDHLYGHISLIR